MRSYDRVFVDFSYEQDIINIYGGGKMGNQTNVSEITAFIEMMKRLIASGKYDFVPRRKNMQALAEHGLTITDAKNEILGLVVSDYYKGPKKDFDPSRPGDIWEFKKNVEGTCFYIKVKITQESGEDILKCMGFHKDDFA